MSRMFEPRDPMILVRFDGRSWTVPASTLRLAESPSEGEVKQAVAGYLEIALADLAPYVVERHENGNLTVRPEAVFG